MNVGMKRKDFLKTAVFIGAGTLLSPFAFAGQKERKSSHGNPPGFAPDIGKLRMLAEVIVGDLPTGMNVTKVADTIRPASVVVKGEAPDRMMTLARTVYQLVYPKGTIMLDSGMDMETHRTFGQTEEPYYPENYQRVQEALRFANLIILTHYHADHVAGVIRSPDFDTLAHKVWVSRDTADLLIHSPHKPTIEIEEEKVNRFIISEFEQYLPVAPGIVLIKAPGHTPDSKMLYIRLENGQEFIHSVDSGWSMENIRKETMKNASWVNENEEQLLQQYRWLNHTMATEENMVVICTHDNEQYTDFIRRGIFGKELKTHE